MGRKIPSKKHRGIKDPVVQQERRLLSLKGKINAPPKDPDEQPIPRSLTRLFSFSNLNNERKRKKTKPKHGKGGVYEARRDNPIQHLKKLPGESGRAFTLRINSAIRTLHGDNENMDYPQDLEEVDAKGERIAFQQQLRARRRRRAEQLPASPATPAPPALSRAQRLALKKKAKKLKAQERAEERGAGRGGRRLPAPLGDVVAAPPALGHWARARAPGRRDLLLHKLLSGGADAGGGGRDGQLAEERREAVVAAYRQLKAARHKQRSSS